MILDIRLMRLVLDLAELATLAGARRRRQTARMLPTHYYERRV